jgi:hypothetical protein
VITKPVIWEAGLNTLRKRKVLPTSLGTDDLRRIGGEVKRWSVFSAKIENAQGLQRINDVVADIIGGGDGPGASVTEGKARLKEAFRALGIEVGDKGKVGTIEDPQSDARLQLIVRTQEEIARGYGKFIAGQDRDVLDVWPCWELVRVSPAGVPRDWEARWRIAGGSFYDGRMIALKNSDVWARLGDSITFKDALGNPYPPFAFNSGMDVEDIDRDTAEELGVIEKFTPTPLPQERFLADDIKASTSNLDNTLRAVLAQDPSFRMDGDVLRLADE